MQGHTHGGDEQGTPVPRQGIREKAIDGSRIDPDATVTVKGLTVSGPLTVDGRAILGEVDDLLKTLKGMASGKLDVKGGTLSGSLIIDKDLSVGGALKAGKVIVDGGLVLKGGLLTSVRVLATGCCGNPRDKEAGVWIDGARPLAPKRSYNLVVIKRADHSVYKKQSYDVYGNMAQASALAKDLNSISDQYIVILQSHDEPSSHRFEGGLPEAIVRVGGSRAVFRHAPWPSRCAYILVGIPNIGEGNGIELLSDKGNGKDVSVETGFFIQGGMVQGLGKSMPVQSPWVTPKMENKWVRYTAIFNPPGFYRDSLGVVHLRGLVKGGANKTTIFTLPAGYRPTFQQLHPVSIWNDTIGRVDVMGDGRIHATKVATQWVSLDGITFRVAD